MYTAFVYFCVYFLHSRLQSLGAHFGFKQCTAPMDSEFALQIGSPFPWYALTNSNPSQFSSVSTSSQSFVTPYIYIYI